MEVTTCTGAAKQMRDSAPAIDLEKVLVVRRLSRFELQQRELGCSEAELEAQYLQVGAGTNPILESHRYFMKQLHNLERVLGAARIVARENADASLLAKHDVIVSLGGDDHFKYVAQLVGDKMIAAVNSDPWRSDGALTSCTIEQLPQLIQALAEGAYSVENWSRLDVSLNGNSIGSAISEIRLGEDDVDDMSHHRICDQVQCAEQKGSGLLVATGAGSTGWIKSAGRYQFPDGNPFDRTEKMARYILREPHEGRMLKKEMWFGEIHDGQSLTVESLDNGDAVVSFDAVRQVPFPRGSKVSVSLAATPLRVLKMQE